MSAKPVVVAVTGANKGIGLAIVESLATNPPATPLHLLACARKPPSSSPIPSTATTKITWHQLDITDPHSISTFASDLKNTHPAGLDILINNAGQNLDFTNASHLEISQRTLAINYHGTLAVTRALLPLMQGPPAQTSLQKRRIVMLSSLASKNVSSERRRQLLACSSLDEIDRLGEDCLSSVREGREKLDGWPEAKAYSVSKAMLNAATAVLARENEEEGVLVNACCPGWCKTEMGALVGEPGKTAEEGARVPIHLAFGDLEGVSGKYWENASALGTGKGAPADWTK